MILTGIQWQRRILFLFMILIGTIKAIPIDNSLIDAETIHDCVINKTVDLILILDGSGSVGDETFQMELEFAVNLAKRLNVSAPQNRMAVIQYAEAPQLEISLRQYTESSQIIPAIRRIKYQSGATNTGQALKFALERGFQDARGGDIPKVAIVVSDGQSQDAVAEAAQNLRNSHVLIYAIGVTNLISVHELHQIAGNPVRVLTVESFDQLDKSLADSLTWDMCKTEFRPGTPDIICASDRIGVRASTRNPFDGYVFVMDHFHEKECRAGPEQFSDPRSIGITVSFSDCNVRRYRSLNPRGIFVEVTVVFMFHTLFMTKVDQMVEIRCFYMEAEKTVAVPLEVSMITTQFREKMYEMPKCEYSLRRSAPDGPVATYASLGESIYHRWECIDQSDTFGMLIHSCYVDNGYGDRVDLLDGKGCGIDAVLLANPEYDETLRLATRAFHVFKYADQPVLQFQCQVTLCIKYDGGCEGITPPKCPETLPHHHHQLSDVGAESRRRSRSLHNPSNTFDIFTAPIQIMNDNLKCPQTIKREVFPHFASVCATIINICILFISLVLYYKGSRTS